MAPKLSSPACFATLLKLRWAAGEAKVRHLLLELRHHGYTGCYSQLAAFAAPWRSNSKAKSQPSPDPVIAPVGKLPLDSRTGAMISPVVAAALCIKPRPDGDTAEQIVAEIYSSLPVDLARRVARSSPQLGH